jgi:hypothetical protein
MLSPGVALAAWIVGQTSAAGDGAPGWLQWSASEAAAGCGDGAAFAAEVERRLGRSPALSAGELGLVIVARVDEIVEPAPRWIVSSLDFRNAVRGTVHRGAVRV